MIGAKAGVFQNAKDSSELPKRISPFHGGFVLRFRILDELPPHWHHQILRLPRLRCPFAILIEEYEGACLQILPPGSISAPRVAVHRAESRAMAAHGDESAGERPELFGSSLRELGYDPIGYLAGGVLKRGLGSDVFGEIDSDADLSVHGEQFSFGKIA